MVSAFGQNDWLSAELTLPDVDVLLVLAAFAAWLVIDNIADWLVSSRKLDLLKIHCTVVSDPEKTVSKLLSQPAWSFQAIRMH